MSIVGVSEHHRLRWEPIFKRGTRQSGIIPTMTNSVLQVFPSVDVMNWEHNITDADRGGVIRQP